MTDKTEQTAAWLEAFAQAMRENPDGWQEGFDLYNVNHGWIKTKGVSLLATVCENPQGVRRAPRRITISGPGGEYSYPEPMRDRPNSNDFVWAAELGDPGLVFSICWVGDSLDEAHYQQGLIHTTEDAAREHAEAIIKAMGGTPS